MADTTAATRQNTSRFAYHGDDDLPAEGGVRSVPAAREKGSNTAGGTSVTGQGGGRPHPAVNGVPGPEERLLDISELVRTIGMHYRHRFQLPAGDEKDFIAVSPIEGEVTLTNTGAILLLRGRAKTSLRMECGRCLSDTEQPVEAEIEEEFDLVTTHNAFHQEIVNAVDEDTPASVIKGNVLDLGDLLRQNLLLAAPLQPLCSDECPGIVHEANPLAREADSSAELTETVSVGAASPLKNLAALLEARRKSEAEASSEAGA